MNKLATEPAWRCSVDLRICHPALDPSELTELLDANPIVAQFPGESKVPHGDCKSAGYWCTEHKIEHPHRVDELFLWLEQFISERENQFQQLINKGYDVNAYVGIHTNVLATGFTIPRTPTLWRLEIPIGVEFFSR